MEKIAFFNGDFPENDRNLLFKIFKGFGLRNGATIISRFGVTEEEAEARLAVKLIYENHQVATYQLKKYLEPPVQIRHRSKKMIEDFLLKNQTKKQREILNNFSEQVKLC